MVWKVRRYLFVLMCICAFSLLATHNAQAYQVYTDGNISSTYVNYFGSILSKHGMDDYVIWRNSQYEYCLAVGDMRIDGYTFRGDVVVYTINTQNQGINNNATKIGLSNDHNFSLANNQHILVYSSLGRFPMVEERGSNIEYTLLFAFITFAICCLINPIFIFVMRYRNGERESR